MKKYLSKILVTFLFIFSFSLTIVHALPEGFVYVQYGILEPRYYSEYNFIGEKIDSYNEPKIILSKEAANALKSANDELKIGGGTASKFGMIIERKQQLNIL